MTTNAFTATGPSQIKFKQQSTKQIKQYATRVNRYEPLCTKSDPDKQQRIQRTPI
jgi:hypothetical protein